MPPLPENSLELCESYFGVVPKELQLTIAERIGCGQDSVLIAGCGWGKTLVYFLPLVLWPDKVVVVISPLKALADEQQQKLARANVPSIALKQETVITTKVIESLAQGTYRAVFMSLEIIFSSRRLRNLWDNPTWRQKLLAIVLDEAHCISTWGDDFRKDYSQIGALRTWIPPRVAFIALSATLPRHVLDVVKNSLHYSPDVAVFNIGNDRINVRYIVSRLMFPANTFRDLAFLSDFVKTIVYFQSRDEAEEAGWFLRRLVRPEDRNKIAVYHAVKSDPFKALIMEGFRNDTKRILLSTEAAGMGCDISNVLRVVQYKCPANLSTLIQRLGRAARDPKLQGEGILLIQPRFLSAQTEETKMDHDLRRFITTTECRRKVLNEVFENEDQHVENCCDRCLPDKKASNDTKTGQDGGRSRKIAIPRTSSALKARALEAIREWRSSMFERDWQSRGSIYHKQHVMQDRLADKLAGKCAAVTTPDSIRRFITWSPLHVTYREDLCNILLSVKASVTAETPNMDSQARLKSHVPAAGPSEQLRGLFMDRTNTPPLSPTSGSPACTPRKRSAPFDENNNLRFIAYAPVPEPLHQSQEPIMDKENTPPPQSPMPDFATSSSPLTPSMLATPTRFTPSAPSTPTKPAQAAVARSAPTTPTKPARVTVARSAPTTPSKIRFRAVSTASDFQRKRQKPNSCSKSPGR